MPTLSLNVKATSADAADYATSGNMRRGMQNAMNLLRGITSGALLGSIYASRSASDPVAASGTVTCASVSANDTVTIGKTTLTAKASPASEDEFSQAGTDTQDAAALVAKINAHSVLSLLVSAANVAGVVTVTSHYKGSLANHIALTSSNGTRLAVSGSGYLASATGGAETAPASLTR